MPEGSAPVLPDASPIAGTGRGSLRLDRLRNCKRESVQKELGKGETWVRDILDGSSGVKLEDIDRLDAALGIKSVDQSKYCVDRDMYESYKRIAAKAINAPRVLEWDSGE
jgi:hypothetical protein